MGDRLQRNGRCVGRSGTRPACCGEGSPECACGPRFTWSWFDCSAGLRREQQSGAIIVFHQSQGSSEYVRLGSTTGGDPVESFSVFHNGASLWCITAAGARLLSASQTFQGTISTDDGAIDSRSLNMEGPEAIIVGGPDAALFLQGGPTFNLNLSTDSRFGAYRPNRVTLPSLPFYNFDTEPTPTDIYAGQIPGTIQPIVANYPGQAQIYGQYGNIFGSPVTNPPIRVEAPYLPTCAKAINYNPGWRNGQSSTIDTTLTDSPAGGSVRMVRRDTNPINQAGIGNTLRASYFASWRRVPLACPGDPPPPPPDPDTRQDRSFPNPTLERLTDGGDGSPPLREIDPRVLRRMGIDPATLRPVNNGPCIGCGE